MKKYFVELFTAWGWMNADVQTAVDAGKFEFSETQMKELTTAGTTISALKTEKQTAEDALNTEKEAHVQTTEKLTKAEGDLTKANAEIAELKKAKAGIVVSIQDKADKIEDKKEDEFLTSFGKEKAAIKAAETI